MNGKISLYDLHSSILWTVKCQCTVSPCELSMNNTGYILWSSIVQYCPINWTRLSCELSRIILWTNKNASYELQNLSDYELSRIVQWSVQDTSLELLSIILLTLKEITFKHCNFGLFLKSTEMDVTLTVLYSANTFLYTYSFSSCGYGECDRRGIDGHQMQRASYTCSTSISTKTRGVISHLSETKGGRS